MNEISNITPKMSKEINKAIEKQVAIYKGNLCEDIIDIIAGPLEHLSNEAINSIAEQLAADSIELSRFKNLPDEIINKNPE